MESVWIKFLKQFAWRMVFALPLIYIGAQIAVLGEVSFGSFGVINMGFNPFLGVGLMVMAGFVIAPPFAELFSQPAGFFYFPQDHFARPLLSYSRADLYLRSGRYAEAAEEFDSILQSYPREERAVIGKLSCLMQFEHRHEAAEQFYYSVLKKIPDGKPHQKIVEAYAMILAKKDLTLRNSGDLIYVALYIPADNMPSFRAPQLS